MRLNYTMRFILSLILVSVACLTGRAWAQPKEALAGITAADLMRHTQTLASDEFEGRLPGSKGEQLTVDYLINHFRRIGLHAGHPNGSYIQTVPLVGMKAESSFWYEAAGKRKELSFPKDYLARSARFLPEVRVDGSEMVFVGYGIVAPEYNWDDYKGVDVAGKTIVMLVNDPPIPDPAKPGELDPKMFKGKAMTYYGRWTYKFEIAAEKKAAAVLIVHETGPAGYPFFVLVAGYSGESFELQSPDKNMGVVPVEGWLPLEQARELFKEAGLDYEAQKQAAMSRDFKPLPLRAKANFHIKNSMREVASQNVIGLVKGSHPQLQNEYVVYCAHWDHIGLNPKLDGDKIYNGAVDNASGVASLLELAEAFASLKEKPKRSVIFLAVTAEEQGLLGAKYYARHPIYPLEKTLAVVNMDSMNPWGRTTDINVIGYGNTSLEAILEKAARRQNRVVTADSEPEKGRYYRSDHFEFAKLGVPGLYLKSGTNFVGKPASFGKEKMDEYTARDYHKVSDEMKPDWDLAGQVEDTQLLFSVGYEVSQANKYPEWKSGAEFKARREEMLRKKPNR